MPKIEHIFRVYCVEVDLSTMTVIRHFNSVGLSTPHLVNEFVKNNPGCFYIIRDELGAAYKPLSRGRKRCDLT